MDFRRKKIAMGIGIGLITLLLLLVGSVSYTSKPSFCNTCHYMAPFYEGWQQSAHKDVECTVCHFEPGLAGTMRGKIEGLLQVAKYVTNAHKRTKPWAEISDASCLRSGCHVERLLEGGVRFKEGIMFDHGPHLSELRRGKNLRCTSCHSQIVQGDHITVTETTCFLCHFKNESAGIGLAECTLCHKQENFLEIQDQIKYNHAEVFEKGYDCLQCHTNTVVGDGAVHLERCYDCHFEPERLERVNDGDFLHQMHITEHKIECVQCHLTIQHKIVKTTQGESGDCSSCHVNLHLAQRTLFSGVLQGHTEMPNPMQEIGLNCKGCHIFHEEANNIGEETFKATEESCERCHGEGYSRLFRNWEAFADRRLERVQKDYSVVKREVSGARLSTLQLNVVNDLMEKAESYLEIVKVGKAVHNIRFSELILSDAGNNLREVVEIIGSGYKVSEFALSSKVIPSDCINCHTDIVENVVMIFGLRYSHEKHLVKADLECRTCHSNVNIHGELQLDRTQCLECHHSQEEKDCSYCHETQSDVYSGGVSGFADIEPDIMFDSEVLCDDCHRDAIGRIGRPGEEQCVVCHDEGYGEMIIEWKESNFKRLTEMEDKVNKLQGRELSEKDRVSLNEAERLIGILVSDGSFGSHNFASYEILLDNELSKLENLLEK